MSRIGNKPINVPAGVEVKLDGTHLSVKGPKGTLERELHKNMKTERPNFHPQQRMQNNLKDLQVSGCHLKWPCLLFYSGSWELFLEVTRLSQLSFP